MNLKISFLFYSSNILLINFKCRFIYSDDAVSESSHQWPIHASIPPFSTISLQTVLPFSTVTISLRTLTTPSSLFSSPVQNGL